MSPNKARGEIVIALAGRDLLLRPTFDALARLETTYGFGFLQLEWKLGGQYSFALLVSVLHECLVQPQLSRDEVGQLIIEEGFLTVANNLQPLGRNLLLAGTRFLVKEEQEEEPQRGRFQEDGSLTQFSMARLYGALLRRTALVPRAILGLHSDRVLVCA